MWRQRVDNAIFLHSLFAPDAVADRVVLHELRLGRDGPSARLRFDVDADPLRFPHKWRDAGHTRAQVQLLAVPVRDLHVEGFDAAGDATLVITPTPQGRSLTVACASCRISFAADFIGVDVITGYAPTP